MNSVDSCWVMQHRAALACDYLQKHTSRGKPHRKPVFVTHAACRLRIQTSFTITGAASRMRKCAQRSHLDMLMRWGVKETLTGLPAASDRPCSISGMWRCLPTCSQVRSGAAFGGQLRVAAFLLCYDGQQGAAGRLVVNCK